MIPFHSYKFIRSDFLKIILKSPYFINIANSSTHGMSLPRFGTDKAQNTLIPITAENEQIRIMEKVDALLSLCDQLEAKQKQATQLQHLTYQAVLDNLTQASTPEDLQTAWQRLQTHLGQLMTQPEQVKGLREAVLQLAVQGKLVPQDANDEPASVLLAKIQAEKEGLIQAGTIKRQKPLPAIKDEEKPFALPKGWKWVRLQDIFALITDGDHQPPPKAEQGFPFLVIGNLNTGNINFDGCRFVSNDYYQNLDWGRKPLSGDILYTVTGSYGIPILVNTNKAFCVQRHVAILKLTSKTPNTYLKFILASKYAFNYATNVATGIAQKTVPLSGLRLMPIPLPPENEIPRIIDKVEALMHLCDQLEAKLQAARHTQGLLAEALTAA
jgi:type I restriction enzyme S subunit